MIHRVLKNNKLNGTLDIGTFISNQLDLLDLQLNYIEKFEAKIDVSKVEIMYAIIVIFILIDDFVTWKRNFFVNFQYFLLVFVYKVDFEIHLYVQTFE